MKLDTKWLGVILFAILALLFLYMAGFFTEKLPTEHDAKTNQIDVNNAEIHQLMLTSEPVVREFPGVVVASFSIWLDFLQKSCRPNMTRKPTRLM
ncbi:hypothetical protein [Vibrio parahaemolyticus]|uniref:hypothetical protein n=1 Tax=Vibrio parahaemolyticus TaxID=670 RepID=UPI0038927455